MLGEERRRRRFIVVSAVVMAAAVAVGGGAPVTAQATDPTVVVDGISPPGVYGYRGCDGEVHGEEYLDGAAFLVSDVAPTTDVTVAVSYSGSLADDLVDPVTTATFGAGEEFGEAYVPFLLDALEPGTLTVTVEPGDGYLVGSPASATVVVDDEPIIGLDCLHDLTPGLGAAADQTIEVGEVPAYLDLFWNDGDDDVADGSGEITVGYGELPDGSFGYQEGGNFLLPEEYSTPVDGDPPPGVSLVRGMWRGTPTTPGTYSFAVRLCFAGAVVVGGRPLDAEEVHRWAAVAGRSLATDVCEGTAQVRITVVAGPDDTTDRTTAPPATAVTTRARFTG